MRSIWASKSAYCLPKDIDPSFQAHQFSYGFGETGSLVVLFHHSVPGGRKMLTEIKGTRQIPGEGRRRWFRDDELDLIVWYEENGAIAGFQL